MEALIIRGSSLLYVLTLASCWTPAPRSTNGLLTTSVMAIGIVSKVRAVQIRLMAIHIKKFSKNAKLWRQKAGRFVWRLLECNWGWIQTVKLQTRQACLIVFAASELTRFCWRKSNKGRHKKQKMKATLLISTSIIKESYVH